MRNVPLAHTDIHSLNSRLSLSVYTDVQNITTPTRTPGHTCHCVTTGHVCHAHTVYYPTPYLAHVSFVFPLSLFATGFPVTPPEPGPAPSPASGFRPSGLLTPVFPGVPTGARNLGVCVIAACVSFRNHPLVLRFINPHHPLLPPPQLSFTPSPHVPSCFSRALPTDSHGSSASPVRDLRRRWVELIVCTETEPVFPRVFSPLHFFRIPQKSLCRLSPPDFASSLILSLPTYNIHRIPPFSPISHTAPLCPIREPSCLFFPLFTSYLGFSCGGA